MRKVLCRTLVLVVILSGCQTEKPEKYVPKSDRKREKYATPEPGTYLKPVAYSILKKINQVIEEPDSYKKPANWMIEMFTTNQKRVVDTLLCYGETMVKVRIYYPNRQSLEGDHPVILYMHGGGFILGSVAEYHLMVSKLAKITGSIVVSVEYRLAPDFPFPAGLMDCFAALLWIQENGSVLGGDIERISVMGDSAGGNLATVLTLLCRDHNRPQPMCQVLIYPGVTFVETGSQSRVYFVQHATKTYVLSESFLRKVKSQYMANETNDRHPYLSPLEADLTPDLAPALVITAECDPIRDGGRLFAQKLIESGVPVEHIEYSGMIHGFMSFHMILSDALGAMKQIRDYLEQI